ncbi:MAG: hypothetical protein JW860_12255 [Sedimentisphaerales bacterium]|nr:hypothetical protein [Sedimentisphaerales bacterium]
MKRDRKYACKLIVVIIIAGISTPVFSSDSYTDKYGVTEGDEINSGFVFIEGKYVEPPYRISRRGLSLYVNEIIINSPIRNLGGLKFIIQGDPKTMPEDQLQRIVKRLNITREYYEKYLSENNTYLFSDTGGHRRLTPYTTAYRLPEIIKIISSDISIEEKELKLKPTNWHLSMDVGNFINNFSAPPQLDVRLKNLAQELLYIDKFGVGEIMTVDQGFLFLHGEYIDTPFSIQRKG